MKLTSGLSAKRCRSSFLFTLILLLAVPLVGEELVVRLTDVSPSSSMAGVRGPLDLFLEFEAGTAVVARGMVPYDVASDHVNGTGAHAAVDASGLSLSGGTLTGMITGSLPVAGTATAASFSVVLSATVSGGDVAGTHSGTYRGAAVSGSVEGTAVAESALPVETDVSVFLDRGFLDAGAAVTDTPIGLNLAFSGGTLESVSAFYGKLNPTMFGTEPDTQVIDFVGPLGDRIYGMIRTNPVSGAASGTGSISQDAVGLVVDVSFSELSGRTFTYTLNGSVIGNVVLGTVDIHEDGSLIASGETFLGYAGDGEPVASRDLPELDLLPAGPDNEGAGFTPPYFGELSPAGIRERALAGALWLTETPEMAPFAALSVADFEETNNKQYDNAAYNSYGGAVSFGILHELASDPQLRRQARKAAENAGYWLDVMGEGNYQGIATYYKQMFHVSAWGALGHMDLYETTGNARWLEAVKGYFTMLEHEVTNRMDGPEVRDFAPDDGVPGGRTWTYLDEATGAVGESNSRDDRSRDNFELNPGTFLWLLGKLRVDHGVTDFAAFEANAAAWVADNIDDDDIWDGGSGVPPADGALFYGLYLLDYAPAYDSVLLDKVVQYAEAELIDWSHPVSEDGLTDRFAPHVKNKVSRWVSGYYPEFVGGTAATSRMALVYLKRYARTADLTDFEKAQALAHSVLRAQKPETGMIHQIGNRDFSADHQVRLFEGPNGAEVDPLFNPSGRQDQHPYAGIKANALRNLVSYADTLDALGLDCDQSQEIVATTVVQKELGDAPFALTATATSGLPVAYQLVYGPATLNGDAVTLDGTAGIVKLIASQAGDATWCAATPVAVYISVGDNTPAAPGDLAASAGSASTITLTWTDNADIELRYRIERRLQGDPDWATLTFLAADSSEYTDTGLPMETAYEYRVIAETLVAESAPSATAGAATPGDEVYIYLEVECEDIGPGYEIRENPDAGGGFDVVTKVDQSAREDIDPATIIEFEFFVPRSGLYNLWLRGRAINGGASDSVWLMVDDGIFVTPDTFYTQPVCNTGYCWRPNNDSFPLEPGVHKITIASRETEAVLDRFLLTTDTADIRNFGIGGPAVNCGGGADAPVLDFQWDPDQEDFAITFFAEAGVFYQLETSTTLETGDWENSGPPFEGTGESVTLRRFPAGDRTFFRIVMP